MTFDPHVEDFQRLALRFAGTLGESDPFGAARAFAGFGQRYAQNRDSLPQSDGDRAFHLVAKATELIDYQLPFATDDACAGLIADARRMLGEALELDPACHDARRMLAASDNPTFEDFYRFLVDGESEVRQACEQARSEALESASGTAAGRDAATLAADLAMRPYVRWVSTEAMRALVCGRYRKCVELCMRTLEADKADPAGVRLTLALALAKLEDAEGLDRLAGRGAAGRARGLRHAANKAPDAWVALGLLSLAFKRRDFAACDEAVASLLADYPHAGLTLARQDELPDGVYSRIVVDPHSEDELILAVSEASVLLQEGRDPKERGSLGSWLMGREDVQAAAERDEKALGEVEGGEGK